MRRGELFVACVLAVEVLVIAAFIANYAMCFQEAECVFEFTPAVIEKGTGFSWHDFVNSFNVWGLDNGVNRPRFLSYFFYIVIIKFRLLLWHVLPPHPTLSPIWVLTLLLTPVLFYKFLKLLIKDTFAALSGTAVYISSFGYLFSGTMLFHPGKPLLNVVVVALLYLVVKHEPLPHARPIDNPAFARYVGRLVLPLLFVSLFLDEMAVFCFFVLPIWQPWYFFPVRWTGKNAATCFKNILIYIAPVLISLFFVLAVAPLITQAAFGKPFDVLAAAKKASSLEMFSLVPLLRHATTLLGVSLLPWGMVDLSVPVAQDIPAGRWILPQMVLLGACLIFTVVVLRVRQDRGGVKKLGLLFAVFLLLQTWVTSLHPLKITVTGYHYGAVFSVLFSILMAVLLTTLLEWKRFGLWLGCLLLCYVIVIQFLNFRIINTSWQRHTDWKTGVSCKIKPLTSPKGLMIFMTEKKIHDALQCPQGSYYRLDAKVADAKEKRDAVLNVWREWRRGRCDIFAQTHDFIFAQNLWLFGELCPEAFSDFH